MLLKFFGSRLPQSPNPSFVGEKPLILQIIHAGGMVERYYMAFPAAWIMEKYPDFVLARPEIFRRPWDSIVPPEEILVPGQKYFVVPIRTVKKLLHQRMCAFVCQHKESLLLAKPKPCNRRVCFKGVESKTRNDSGVDGKKSSNGKGLRKKNVRFHPSLTMIDEGSDD